MAIYKISRGKSASFIHGYGSRGVVTNSIAIPGFSLGAGAQSSYSFTLPNTSVTAGLNIMVNITGTSITEVDGRWLPVPGTLAIRRGVPTYDIQLQILRDANIVTIFVVFYNNTGISQSVPNIGVSAKGLLFTPPW